MAAVEAISFLYGMTGHDLLMRGTHAG